MNPIQNSQFHLVASKYRSEETNLILDSTAYLGIPGDCVSENPQYDKPLWFFGIHQNPYVGQWIESRSASGDLHRVVFAVSSLNIAHHIQRLPSDFHDVAFDSFNDTLLIPPFLMMAKALAAKGGHRLTRDELLEKAVWPKRTIRVNVVNSLYTELVDGVTLGTEHTSRLIELQLIPARQLTEAENTELNRLRSLARDGRSQIDWSEGGNVWQNIDRVTRAYFPELYRSIEKETRGSKEV